jgi:molybdate transport system substrate-binding protein
MRKLLIYVLVLMVLAIPFYSFAQDKISVAVAANFISAFKEIAADFEDKTGVKVEATFASTGSLYNQIKNGAPYDVFLSADEERPALLKKDGWTERTFIYASGNVVLWSANKDFCKTAGWSQALKSERIKKIAIINPQTAPYGAAAKAAMQKTGLWDTLSARLVYAQDNPQSFQYAAISAVDASFCSLSMVALQKEHSGCYYVIPEAPVITQFACASKKAKSPVCAELFVSFLLSEHANKIKKKYGYH